MIQETIAWMTAQNVWAQPIVNFLVAVACLKYIIFDWGR